MKRGRLDEAGLARVRREAQAMGRLGDLRHIGTIFSHRRGLGTTSLTAAAIVRLGRAGVNRAGD